MVFSTIAHWPGNWIIGIMVVTTGQYGGLY